MIEDGKPIRNKSIKLKVNATDLAYKKGRNCTIQ